MKQSWIDARLMILNAMLALSKDEQGATKQEVEWAMAWFKKSNVAIALEPASSRYVHVVGTNEPTAQQKS